MANLQSVTDVLFDGHAREQGVRLKDHASATFARRQVGHVLAMQNDIAAVGLFEPGDDAQDRCLAAA